MTKHEATSTQARSGTGDDAPRTSAIILTLALGSFAIGTAEFAAMSLLPDIAVGLGIAEPVATRVVSAYALGVVVGAPAIAIACARVQPRLLLIALMASYAALNGLSAAAPSLWPLLALRFASGLPHGAYLGVAALMAASQVERGRRARAVSMVMLGLTVAMIFGVALATAIGQYLGWRWGFVLPATISAYVAIRLALLAPHSSPAHDNSPLEELSGLRNRQLWLTLLTGAIGFAGFFAVYAFTSSTLVSVSQFPKSTVPALVAIYGLGMTLGTVVAGRMADRNLMPTPAVFLALSAASLIAFAILAQSKIGVVISMCFVGFAAATSGVLQTRLMDVAGRAQTIAAVLNHGAFNLANAIGPWLSSIAVASGFGYASTGFVGAALATGGLLIWLYSWRVSVRGPYARGSG